MKTFLAIAAGVVLMCGMPLIARTSPAGKGLTDVPGIKVGHHTLKERPTGCTVILVERGAIAGVDVRGAAPATHETDLLAPGNLVEQVHGLVLSGGSAWGTHTAAGVMRYLEEHKIGFEFGGAYVPIVPGAALFDLTVGNNPRIRPDASCGYEAAKAATDGPVAEGNVGAGAGATVGKFARTGHPMKGGIGTASITMPDGLIVAALVAVNAAGDVIDPSTGQIIAGARTADGQGFADVRKLLRSGAIQKPRGGQNTTLAVVATNAKLTDAQATRFAAMGQVGLGRAIVPANTMVDGDIVFSLATGTHAAPADLSVAGALAADVTAQAIVRAVQAATSIPGYPAARDLK